MDAGSFRKIVLLLVCLTLTAECVSRRGRRWASKPFPHESEHTEHYRVRRNVGQAGTNLPKCLSLYDLPVHFHVIKAKDGRGNVTAEVLDKQLKVLNEAYNGSIFEFTLHGMNWIENDEWTSYCGKYKDVYKQKYAVDTMRVLNIYICPIMASDNVYGDSVFPWEHPEGDKRHGVIIDTDTLPGGADPFLNMGKNAVHETGHYFGLFLIHKDGCNPNLPGDYVDDTPAQEDFFGCAEKGQDTCPDMPGVDIVDNYMGSADDVCMHSFTAGQIDRMNYMFRKYHPWLVKEKAMRPCALQGIFRWNNGVIYMFAGDKYYRYDEDIHNINEKYPKKIEEFWKGVPDSIDDVFMDKEERTYFIKDGLAYQFVQAQSSARYPKPISTIWKGVPDSVRAGFQYSDGYLYLFDDKVYYKVNTTTETVVAGYPQLMSSRFKGVPEDVASALTWYNDDVYFFKNESYWVWSPTGAATKKKPISDWWRKRPELKRYVTLWHCNGLTYFFNGSSYWRFDDDKFQVDKGYPKPIKSVWEGVPDDLDDGFTGRDGNLYFFKGDKYYTYNPDTGKTEGQSSLIRDGWKGVPNDIDGVFIYSNGLTYFFKGDNYFRFNDTTKQVDPGYPKKINSFWKGVPDDISSVMRWSNGMTYFFKGDKYYRFNDTSESVDPGYPLSIATWKGMLYQP